LCSFKQDVGEFNQPLRNQPEHLGQIAQEITNPHEKLVRIFIRHWMIILHVGYSEMIVGAQLRRHRIVFASTNVMLLNAAPISLATHAAARVICSQLLKTALLRLLVVGVDGRFETTIGAVRYFRRLEAAPVRLAALATRVVSTDLFEAALLPSFLFKIIHVGILGAN